MSEASPRLRRTLEEWLVHTLVPGRLYIWRHARRALRRGERELSLLPVLVDPNRAALDVGANKGDYSYFLSRLCPRVVAFECNPKIVRFLRRTVAANVEVEEVALSDQAGQGVMRIPRGSRGHSNQRGTLAPKKIVADVTEVPVRMRRLDDYGFDDVGFVKVDVEGFELRVLEGARETLARCRPVLLLELEEIHLEMPLEAAFDAVRAHGYRGLALTSSGLVDLDRFDVEGYHRNPASRSDYVFNYIFLPAGA
ncbi:MAG: FkbM family methyltransferase [Bauldia litoralis]